MKRFLLAMAAVLPLLVSCGKENNDEDYGLFREPILTWGVSQDDIISQLGTPDKQTADVLEYISETDNILYSYDFWKNAMTGVEVYLPYAVPFADIMDFLKEKYVFREEFSDENQAYFNTKDGKCSIWANPDIMGARGIAYSKNTGDPL